MFQNPTLEIICYSNVQSPAAGTAHHIYVIMSLHIIFQKILRFAQDDIMHYSFCIPFPASRFLISSGLIRYDFQFVRRLLPLVHLVVVTGFQFVVSLVVGLVVFSRGGEPRIVLRFSMSASSASIVSTTFFALRSCFSCSFLCS